MLCNCLLFDWRPHFNLSGQHRPPQRLDGTTTGESSSQVDGPWLTVRTPSLPKAHLAQKVAEDVQRLAPHQRTFTHRDPLHGVRVHVLLLHLVLWERTKTHDTERRTGTEKNGNYARYLFCWDAVELRQQPEPILLFDQDALQSLLVLLNLGEFAEIIASARRGTRTHAETHL